MDTDEITQDQVDEARDKTLIEYNNLLKESGKSEMMFRISHQSMQFLGEYEMCREAVQDMGLTMAPLIDGVQVEFKD